MMTNHEAEIKLRILYRELDNQFNIGYKHWLNIVISSRLRSSNGRCQRRRIHATGEITWCRIIMSRALLDEFGWERFEETFRHEVAHLANAIIGGKNHDKSFKRLCKAFGGSMNTGMARGEFASCASNDYVKTIKRWQYTCPCGHTRQTAKRMSSKKRGSRHYTCGYCRRYKLDTWKETRIG